MSAGRPLRFLIAAVGGWTALRVFALWPVPAGVTLAAPAAAASPSRQRVYVSRPWPSLIARTGAPVRSPAPAPSTRSSAMAPISPVLLPTPDISQPLVHAPFVRTVPPPFVLPPLASPPSRWAASAWAIARGGRRTSLLGGQLGASQVGARATYLVDARRRIALSARIAAPLRGRGAEAGIGVDWQPMRLPVHVIAEQRIGLDGIGSGPALFVVGGFGPTEVAHRIRAEGYGQAGGIVRDGAQGFADGAARVSYALVERRRTRFELGVGAWGWAQRGAARLDVGPSLGLVAPVGRTAVRVTLDWRQRIAGDAAPGSGLALSIGTDF